MIKQKRRAVDQRPGHVLRTGQPRIAPTASSSSRHPAAIATSFGSIGDRLLGLDDHRLQLDQLRIEPATASSRRQVRLASLAIPDRSCGSTSTSAACLLLRPIVAGVSRRSEQVVREPESRPASWPPPPTAGIGRSGNWPAWNCCVSVNVSTAALDVDRLLQLEDGPVRHADIRRRRPSPCRR